MERGENKEMMGRALSNSLMKNVFVMGIGQKNEHLFQPVGKNESINVINQASILQEL